MKKNHGWRNRKWKWNWSGQCPQIFRRFCKLITSNHIIIFISFHALLESFHYRKTHQITHTLSIPTVSLGTKNIIMDSVIQPSTYLPTLFQILRTQGNHHHLLTFLSENEHRHFQLSIPFFEDYEKLMFSNCHFAALYWDLSITGPYIPVNLELILTISWILVQLFGSLICTN